MSLIQWPFIVLLAALAVFTLAAIIWRLYLRRLGPFELKTETVDIGAWTWRYNTSGKGPDLILIHGIGANLYCWRHLIPHINQDYRVWAIDLPGFGGSSKLKDAHYGLDDQVERLAIFMDRMGIQQAYLVGNSMGGNIALWLAKQKPERILGVAVIAPATSPTLMPLNMQRLVWLAAPASLFVNRIAIRWVHGRIVSRRELIDSRRIEESFTTYSRKPSAVRAFMRATEAIRDPRLPSQLKAISRKVLLLWGSADLLVSKKIISDLEAALVAPESHVHEGGGHHLQEDDPQWVSRQIVRFFGQGP